MFLVAEEGIRYEVGKSVTAREIAIQRIGIHIKKLQKK